LPKRPFFLINNPAPTRIITEAAVTGTTGKLFSSCPPASGVSSSATVSSVGVSSTVSVSSTAGVSSTVSSGAGSATTAAALRVFLPVALLFPNPNRFLIA